MVRLIAEIFDNGTRFSPQHQAVTVEAVRTGDGAVFLIEDRGLGMSYDGLAELNLRLATPPPF
jgi:K+-sensing histidine kinase KdpD